jgi:hypothetical protein
MSNIKRFEYNGQRVTFQLEDGTSMVNATEMAKPFKKRPNDFLRTAGTKAFILALEEDYREQGVPKTVLHVVQDGKQLELQGTWMDEHLALKFAGWLEPRFEVWVYKKIRELLQTGKTEIKGRDGQFGYVLREIAERFDEQELKNQDFDARIKEVEGKLLTKDENYYSIAGFASLYKVDCPLKQAQAWGKAALALSKKHGVATGQTHDERYGKVRTYHSAILQRVILGK